MITLVRCDDRLIHGQTMTSVIKEYNIKEIIVVDNFIATNPILRDVFQMTVDGNMKASVFTIEGSLEIINNSVKNDISTLLLMRTPEVFLELRGHINGLPDRLNIGPMSSRKGTISATNFAYLTDSEIKSIKELVSQGVEVYFKQVASSKVIQWEEIENKFT